MSGRSDPTDLSFVPPGGLGIEGITTHSKFEHHEAEPEIEDCASADANHEHLRPPGEHKNNSGTNSTAIQEGILTSTA
jgi:hypothetical protein